VSTVPPITTSREITSSGVRCPHRTRPADPAPTDTAARSGGPATDDSSALIRSRLHPGGTPAASAKLTLISHGMTAALRAGRCAVDEPLEDAARVAAEHATGGVPRPARTLCDLTLRTTQTAHALGLDPTPEPALADLDLGAWTGQALTDLPAGELAAWICHPARAPHGGESTLDLIDRARSWLHATAELPGRTIAITHPAVIRAALIVALNASPDSFWRIDVPPHLDHAARPRPTLDAAARLPAAWPH